MTYDEVIQLLEKMEENESLYSLHQQLADFFSSDNTALEESPERRTLPSDNLYLL